jgi:D-glucosaminate-specific PTS system IIB component
MGKIAMCRVDYRLVHGQVAATWIKKLNVNRVVILDDQTAADKFMVQVMGMATPGTKISAYSIEDGVKNFTENQFGPGRILVIFREVKDAFAAYEKGFTFDSLNVGQVPMQEGRRRAVGTICLSDDEYDMLSELSSKGVEVYNHQTYVDQKYTFSDITNAMKK